MPKLLKYSTEGLIDDVPDLALSIIEYSILSYIVDKRFKGNNKYIAFAVIGASYEILIDGLKKQSPKDNKEFLSH